VLREYPLCLLLLAAFGLSRTLAEGRRAIIFNESEVLYRPPFGQPVHALINDIQSLKRSKVTLSAGLRPARVSGVLMKMENGETITFPLDFRQHYEILRRLSAITGKRVC
jgi:hypothetical protein